MKNAWTKHNKTRSGQTAAMRPARAPTPPPPPPRVRDPNEPKPGSIEAMRASLPAMTVVQLTAFRDNATRISAEDGNKKQEQASELLPMIDAELEARNTARATADANKRKTAVEKRAATRVARKRETEAAGKLESKASQ